jgi:hypothetical protein
VLSMMSLPLASTPLGSRRHVGETSSIKLTAPCHRLPFVCPRCAP